MAVTTPLPYAPSLRWWRCRAAALPLPAVKNPARTLVDSNQGPRWLTVPTVAHSRPLLLSEHGKWRHVHLEALRAQYGAAPYFQHYLEALEQVYNAPHVTLQDLCLAMDRFITDRLRLDELPEMRRLSPQILREYALKADPALSILDPLFRLGPLTTILLATDTDR